MPKLMRKREQVFDNVNPRIRATSWNRDRIAEDPNAPVLPLVLARSEHALLIRDRNAVVATTLPQDGERLEWIHGKSESPSYDLRRFPDKFDLGDHDLRA